MYETHEARNLYSEFIKLRSYGLGTWYHVRTNTHFYERQLNHRIGKDATAVFLRLLHASLNTRSCRCGSSARSEM